MNKTCLSNYIPKTSSGSFDSCLRYDSDSAKNTTHQCDQLIYESSEITIALEGWGLDCDSDKFKLNLVGSLNSAGQVFGAFYVGYLSDRYKLNQPSYKFKQYLTGSAEK